MGHAVRRLRARVTSGACSLWHTYRTCRYALLFYSLLLTLAVVPLRRALGFSTGLLELFLALNLLAAVLPIRGRKTRRVLLPFLMVVLVGQGSTSWLGNRSGCENRNHAAACDFWALLGSRD